MGLLRAIRGLLVMHLQSGFNGGLRTMGGVSAQLSVVVLLLLVGAFAGAMGLMLFGVGFEMAPKIAEGQYVGGVGAAFTGLTLMGPLVAIMVGEGRELDWERLRLFPLRPVALFVVELVAMLGDPVMVIVVVAMVGLSAGLTVGVPALALPALLVLGCSVAASSALRLVLSSVLARALSKARGALVLGLAVAPPLVGLFLIEKGEDGAGRQFELWGQWAAVLPASAQLNLLHLARTGAWGEAALSAAGTVLCLALLAALAVRGVLAEVSSQAATPTAKPERLWTFTSPTWGIARLQLVTVLESEIGRFSVVAPLVWLAPMALLTRVPVIGVPPGALAPSVWFFLPTLMAGFLLNQFGLDRGAVKGLFLLPISELQLLRGKALGYAMLLGLQAGVVALASAALLRPAWHVWVSGPLSTVFLFTAMLTVGQWTSVVWPRPTARRGLKQAPGTLALGLVVMGVMVGTMLPLSLLWALLYSTPLALCAALVALDAVGLAVFFFYAAQAARVLAQRREKLVESLG